MKPQGRQVKEALAHLKRRRNDCIDLHKTNITTQMEQLAPCRFIRTETRRDSRPIRSPDVLASLKEAAKLKRGGTVDWQSTFWCREGNRREGVLEFMMMDTAATYRDVEDGVDRLGWEVNRFQLNEETTVPRGSAKGWIERCSCSAADRVAIDTVLEQGTSAQRQYAEKLAIECSKGGAYLQGAPRRRKKR